MPSFCKSKVGFPLLTASLLLAGAPLARADRVAHSGGPSSSPQVVARPERHAPPAPIRVPVQTAPLQTPATAVDTGPISVEADGSLSRADLKRLKHIYSEIFGEFEGSTSHSGQTVPSFTGVYSATKPAGSSSEWGSPIFWTPPGAGKVPSPVKDFPDEHFAGLDCNSHPGETDMECMVCNIYFEARNQMPKGQIEVGQTVLTRVTSAFYPDTVCKNVYAFKQFSWTLPSILRFDQRHLPDKMTPVLKTVIESARAAFAAGPNGMDSYYAFQLVTPVWQRVCRPHDPWVAYGAHRFCSVHPQDLASRN